MPFRSGQKLTAAALNAIEPTWAPYTPTNVGVTVGNGTLAARKAYSGRLVFFEWTITFGSTSAFTTTVQIGLPETTVSPESSSLAMRDAATRSWPGSARCGAGSATATLEHGESGNTGQVNATNPFTFGTGDLLVVSGHFEY